MTLHYFHIKAVKNLLKAQMTKYIFIYKIATSVVCVTKGSQKVQINAKATSQQEKVTTEQHGSHVSKFHNLD